MCVEEGCLGLLLKEETLGVFFHVGWGETIGGECGHEHEKVLSYCLSNCSCLGR